MQHNFYEIQMETGAKILGVLHTPILSYYFLLHFSVHSYTVLDTFFLFNKVCKCLLCLPVISVAMQSLAVMDTSNFYGYRQRYGSPL